MKNALIIDVTPSLRVIKDEYSFQPEIFILGGKEVRNPKTGEVTLSKDRWETQHKWFGSLANCLWWAAQQEMLNNTHAVTISGYVDTLKKLYSTYNENLKEKK